MPDTPNTTRRQRLEAAGYVHVSAWLPAAYARKVQQQADFHAEDVERVGAQGKPRGRRPKAHSARHSGDSI